MEKQRRVQVYAATGMRRKELEATERVGIQRSRFEAALKRWCVWDSSEDTVSYTCFHTVYRSQVEQNNKI